MTALNGEFSETIPPAFDGRSDYASYRKDVELWQKLTSLPEKKQGPALIGVLVGEAKSSGKTLNVNDVASQGGVALILYQLDKSYGVNQTDQLDLDLADFLDFTRTLSMTVVQFVAEFHTRLDKIADLDIDYKLKEHLISRHTSRLLSRVFFVDF